MSDQTGGLRGSLGYVPSWVTSCGGNPALNDILDNIDNSDTDNLDEGVANLYYTDGRADARIAAARGAANGIAPLDASSKVPVANLPDAVLGALQYQGTWNANTNTPAIVSGVGTDGHYYVVSVAGTTSIDGVADWEIGDWIVFNGTVWEKIDNSDKVSSVNGQVGVVALDAGDIGTDTSNFDKNLSAADDTIQKALETLDELNVSSVLAGDGWVSSGLSFSYISYDSTHKLGVIRVTGSDVTGTFSVGMKLRLSQPTDGVKYAFIHKVEFTGGNTDFTIWLGTDYDLDSEAVNTVSYSGFRAPYLFPMQKDKWTVEVSDVSQQVVSSVASFVWVNPGSTSIDIPLGLWDVEYFVIVEGDSNSSTNTLQVQATLSTANNSESDVDFTSMLQERGIGNVVERAYGYFYRRKELELAASDEYFLNSLCSYNNADIKFDGNISKTFIRAISQYI